MAKLKSPLELCVAGSIRHLLMRALACAVSVFLFPVWMSAASRNLLVAEVSSQVIQNTRADTDNLSRMRDIRMIQRFVRKGYLVSVPSSTHSYLCAYGSRGIPSLSAVD